MTHRGLRGDETPLLGVIGWPLGQTFSPAMQSAALEAVGLDWRYDPIPVQPDALASWVASASRSMRGFNVTVPHKPAIAALCDELDDLSRAAGAVNTVTIDHGGRLVGYNTDGPGMLDALHSRAGFVPAGSRVVIIGAGGSARGCAAQLAAAGANEIAVINRGAARAHSLCAAMAARFPATAWHNLAGSDVALPLRAELVLSCVPPDGSDYAEQVVEMVPRGVVFMDLNYGRSPTSLHISAQRRGLAAVPGLEMLLRQGIRAFELFTGLPAPVESMQGALSRLAGGWWQC